MGNTGESRGTVTTEERQSDEHAGEEDVGTIDAADIEDLPGPDRLEADELDIGEVFELLKNERRRRVIEFLKDAEDGATTLDVLAEHIAALENDIEVAQLSSSQRKRVYIALYQCHLPKMDTFGVIDYDKNRGSVELQSTSLLDPYLSSSPADEDEATEPEAPAPDRTDIGLALAVATVAVVGMTGIGALAAVPAGAWTLLSVGALLWVAAT